MEAILWSLYEYILCLIEVLLLFNFLEFALKRNDKKNNKIYYFSMILLSVFIYILTEINIYSIGRFILMFILILFMTYKLFKGNIKEKVVFVTIFYFFIIFADIITVNIISNLISKDIHSIVINQTWARVLISQISKLLLFIFLRIIKNSSKEKELSIPKYYWYWIMIVYLISGVNLLLIFKVGLILNNLNIGIQGLTISISIGSLLIVLITYYVFVKLNEFYKEKNNYKIVAIKNEMLIKEMREKEKLYEEVRKIHHDFTNHIICIEELLEQEKVESVKSYIGNLKDETVKTYSWIKTGNDVVDAILNQKRSEGKEKSISMDMKVNIPSDIKIKSSDLCTILGNALDNGIEANETIKDLDKRNIILNIKPYKDYLSIEISNPVSINPIDEEGNLETTKVDKENHGLGIKSIKSTVEKYNGILNYEYNDGIFTLNIMVPVR